MPREINPAGFDKNIMDDDFRKEIVDDLLGIVKDMETERRDRLRGREAGSQGEKISKPSPPTKADEERVKGRIENLNAEELSRVHGQLNRILLDKNKSTALGSLKRQSLREALQWIAEVAVEKQAKQAIEEGVSRPREALKTPMEQARDIFNYVLNDKKYLAELFDFNDEGIFIYDLRKLQKGQDFGIQFNRAEEDSKLLVCKVRLTPEAQGKENRIKWFRQEKDLTLGEESADKKPIYVNLILQQEDLDSLKRSLGKKEIRNDLIDSVQNDLETQLAVTLLDRMGQKIKEQNGGGKEINEDAFEHFKAALIYEKKDFKAAVKELEDYLAREFPEIKNDPIIRNTLAIAGRMKQNK